MELIREYVAQGGSFLMIGGYMSFTGIDAKTRYGETAIADILPIKMLPYDDRVEKPEGVNPAILHPEHPVFEGIDEEWPHFLGYNKTLPQSDSGEILAIINGDPFVGIREYGKGRTGIFSSDCAPHWGPVEFTSWKYYDLFWKNLMDWLVERPEG
nr:MULTISPECIES: glutamine amidotransferase [unclassified Oceanispirochaeta]